MHQILMISTRQTNNWLVVSDMFYFHPYLGRWSNLTNMFQMGWNHQLMNQDPNFRTQQRNWQGLVFISKNHGNPPPWLLGIITTIFWGSKPFIFHGHLGFKGTFYCLELLKSVTWWFRFNHLLFSGLKRGRWTHFDVCIFFRWVGEKPPTRYTFKSSQNSSPIKTSNQSSCFFCHLEDPGFPIAMLPAYQSKVGGVLTSWFLGWNFAPSSPSFFDHLIWGSLTQFLDGHFLDGMFFKFGEIMWKTTKSKRTFQMQCFSFMMLDFLNMIWTDFVCFCLNNVVCFFCWTGNCFSCSLEWFDLEWFGF